MSTFGTQTRTFLTMSVTARRVSEDYQDPGPATYEVQVNEVSLAFRPDGRRHWSFFGDRAWGFLLGVPFVGLLDVSWQNRFLTETSVSGDYPDSRSESCT